MWMCIMFCDEYGVFVVIGDILVMWLCDFLVQLWLFLIMCDFFEVICQIGDVIVCQWYCIDVDFYVNVFNFGLIGVYFDVDDFDVVDELWECKYEVDLLVFFVDLVWWYWQVIGSLEYLNGVVYQGCICIIDVWSLEQDYVWFIYCYVCFVELFDIFGCDGLGILVGYIGMIWSGFCFFDDVCCYGYNILVQFMVMCVLC